MTTFLQILTAFFAVVGLFETLWQITLLFCRKTKQGKAAQILIVTDEFTDPAFLAEDLRLLSNHLISQQSLRIWLICPPGAAQEKTCHHLAQQFDTVRVVSPEKLPDEVRALLEER